MNSCILMAQIIQDPELRYTADSQLPLAQMLVEFSGLRAEDPPTRLRVVGWGNFASEIKENYAVGDRVVIEGRLSMNTIERSEGFKEKRAELTANRIYKLGADTEFQPHVAASATTSDTPTPTSTKSNNVVVPMKPRPQSASPSSPNTRQRDYDTDSSFEPVTSQPVTTATPEPQPDLDDIPF